MRTLLLATVALTATGTLALAQSGPAAPDAAWLRDSVAGLDSSAATTGAASFADFMRQFYPDDLGSDRSHGAVGGGSVGKAPPRGGTDTGNSGARDHGSVGSDNSGAGSVGSANSGSGNVGNGNSGAGNVGSANSGSGNVGNGNSGSGNVGSANSGSGNVGNGNSGDGNVGSANSGSGNVGNGNSGAGNVGNANSGGGSVGSSDPSGSNAGTRPPRTRLGWQ